ncbi:UbiH/UbiF/VisC/COQ6 family ubiquinone biosynthesis hydroxylase [Legionella anisa]|uniref:FAD-dependent oxidoreductase n=1 Tax=Legionella anisa TaxID=28082 RepID=A0AAX0WQ43_9GAMM|nr:UbiH/UbiF/VisC/COQ6 family ubiquinone biosynthesis hydroxylase [Legionella anisa]AWN72949.1 FAD-dependent oxidoreductase [Legionella anisa]KTC70595.1 oxidoreductase with FAD/NAD(P)-binding domain protein [Legionella anisa]MBN5935106.1 UbiH/UbiF/VisC/COQ6 family ubiquinone biosynthesis hydroxylase [Legionella anisa]MCW8423762.1 UbiH/UbiF/VisC/COQ6 family ubiquinone biosynthesis hydroxylase [Legionella anisa]MCW8447282.1 UbiH/UbiF/VisC/COQ6 family ubiquinone biosynthesis hydroxylase [Legionel
MSLQFNVLIIGGGIVGLTAALAMAQRGYSVAVIDAGSLKVDSKRSDTRVYAINHASRTLLQQLNTWQHLDMSRVSPYRCMYVWDAESKAHIDFDSRYVGAQNLGSIIEESVLKHALLHQVSTQSSIHLFPESQVEEVFSEETGVKVCSKQHAWEGQLLMIADGANSPTRQKFKVPLSSWSYEQHALVATVSVEKPHQQTAYQVFRADGPLAFLPLADVHQCSIVWSTDPSHAKKLMSFSDEEFNASLTQAFAKKLGRVEVISRRHQFPLHMRHVKQYVGDRWLLLGDAAHTIHPLAGLGLNVGLADVSSWIRYLDAAQDTLLSKKALGAYQRERKHEVWQIIMLMEGFKRLFSNSFMPLVALRGLGLSLCNGLTSIKRLFIQHAQGIQQ